MLCHALLASVPNTWIEQAGITRIWCIHIIFLYWKLLMHAMQTNASTRPYVHTHTHTRSHIQPHTQTYAHARTSTQTHAKNMSSDQKSSFWTVAGPWFPGYKMEGKKRATWIVKSVASQVHDWVVYRLGRILGSVGHRVKIHKITRLRVKNWQKLETGWTKNGKHDGKAKVFIPKPLLNTDGQKISW